MEGTVTITGTVLSLKRQRQIKRERDRWGELLLINSSNVFNGLWAEPRARNSSLVLHMGGEDPTH